MIYDVLRKMTDFISVIPFIQASVDIYRRVTMPPLQQIPSGNVFQFPRRERRSCIVIKTRVIHSQRGIRKELAHDLISMAIGHGFVRRVSSSQVDVMIVLPNIPELNLNTIAKYFAIKWNVVEEDYFVESNNFTEVGYLTMGLRVFKSSIPDPDGKSLDEDLDLMSVDGYSVVSDR
jgi:hypothetical protein